MHIGPDPRKLIQLFGGVFDCVRATFLQSLFRVFLHGRPDALDALNEPTFAWLLNLRRACIRVFVCIAHRKSFGVSMRRFAHIEEKIFSMTPGELVCECVHAEKISSFLCVRFPFSSLLACRVLSQLLGTQSLQVGVAFTVSLSKSTH